MTMSDEDHKPKGDAPVHRPGEAREGAFFGRRKGKTLRKGQAERLESQLPTLSLDLAAPTPTAIADLFPHAPGEVRLEIGFGGGEHLNSPGARAARRRLHRRRGPSSTA